MTDEMMDLRSLVEKAPDADKDKARYPPEGGVAGSKNVGSLSTLCCP